MKDKEIQKLIKAESDRQRKTINLIASENYPSRDVLDALSSPFINKYSEGYPGKRYYAGNKIVDELETLCQKRALGLFKLSSHVWSVNVQLLSGAQANLAVYHALVPLGSKIISMELSHGGHLSHGQRASITGKLWKQVPYGVSRKTERLDYGELKKIAKKERPQMIVAGFTAYPRDVNYKKIGEIARSVGAIFFVDFSHTAGLVAGRALPSPFPHADIVMTTTHKTLRGPRAALIFSRQKHASLIDKTVFPGLQGGPHMNQVAAVAVALKEAMTPAFRRYAKQVVKNAKVLGEELKKHGFRLVSGGTDTHLLLVDVWRDGTGMSGKDAQNLLEKNRIIVNKNTIPFDTRTPFNPSGIRLGTPAETTRGKKEKDMKKIAKDIKRVLGKQ